MLVGAMARFKLLGGEASGRKGGTSPRIEKKATPVQKKKKKKKKKTGVVKTARLRKALHSCVKDKTGRDRKGTAGISIRPGTLRGGLLRRGHNGPLTKLSNRKILVRNMRTQRRGDRHYSVQNCAGAMAGIPTGGGAGLGRGEEGEIIDQGLNGREGVSEALQLT